ncbi:hypothetical protein ACFL6I_19490 [candidate division KSB1 bacterium]
MALEKILKRFGIITMLISSLILAIPSSDSQAQHRRDNGSRRDTVPTLEELTDQPRHHRKHKNPLTKYRFRGWRPVQANETIPIHNAIFIVRHETSKHYGGIKIKDMKGNHIAEKRAGDPFQFRWVGLEYLLFNTIENKSRYGGHVPVQLRDPNNIRTWKILENTRNPELTFAHTYDRNLLLGVKESRKDHGGLVIYDQQGSRYKLRMGDPIKIARKRNAFFVFTHENHSTHGGLYIVNQRTKRKVGRVPEPARVRPIFNENLIFVGAKETSKAYGGVYVFDMKNHTNVYMHKSGDPFRVERQGTLIRYTCSENSSKYGRILLLDAKTGKKISFERD